MTTPDPWSIDDPGPRTAPGKRRIPDELMDFIPTRDEAPPRRDGLFVIAVMVSVATASALWLGLMVHHTSGL